MNVDFHRRETPVGPPVERRVARETFLADARRAGLRLVREPTFLPYQYFLILDPLAPRTAPDSMGSSRHLGDAHDRSEDQKRDDAATAVEVPPHPTLREYYGANDSRQGFLNELFNRTAYQYRAIDKVVGFGWGLWHRRRALRGAGLRPGMRVLDVACGPGLTTQCALDLAGPTGYVVGLDPSSGMLREARKGPCRNLIRGVGEQLPFPDGTSIS